MKAGFTFLNLFFLLIVLFSIPLIVHGQQNTLWDYPIKPGMEEWATLRTKKQMIDACQIPLEILNNSNTKDLVTICLNYPMFNDYLIFNNERKGICVMIQRFNGLMELSQRENKIPELIQAYSNFPILTQLQKDPTSKEYHLPYKLPFLELVLCDTLFLNKMNNDELEELRVIALNKYVSELQNPDVYSLFNIKKTMLLIASVIIRQNNATILPEQQDTLKTFIESYNYCSHNLLIEVSKIITL